MKNSLLLRDFRLFDPSEKLDKISDILIEDGKITKIDEFIDISNVEIIQGNKQILLPGLIDFHVHYRDPGETYKEEIFTGSRASAKGGFTTVIMMANTNPTMDNINSLLNQKESIDKNSLIRTLQTASVTIGRQGEEIVDIDSLSKFGVVSFSDDGDVIQNEKILVEALRKANSNKRTILEHCEDEDWIRDGVVNLGQVSLRLGLKGRARKAEISSISRDIEVARKNNLWVYLQHVSCKESVELIRNAKKDGVDVTAEVTPHHLFMNENWTYGNQENSPSWIDIDSFETNTRVNPPLRTEEDRLCLIEALLDGTIDIVATDHAPHSKGDKNNTFDEAPAGINGAETAILSLLTMMNKNELRLENIVSSLCTKPGSILEDILGLKVGKIKVGFNADFVSINPTYEIFIDEDFFVSKSSNSPLIGKKMKGKVNMTIFDGKIVYEDNNE